MVMAGNRLVNGQHRHFPQRPLVELGRVDEVEAGDALLGRALVVISGGGAGGGLGRDFLQPIGKPRQQGEEAGHLPVDLLRLARSDLQQFLGRFRIIFGVGAQVGDIRLAGREAGAFGDLFHVGPDPRHLAQAERVDLVGIQVGGGELADQPVVISAPVRLRMKRLTDFAQRGAYWFWYQSRCLA